MKTITKEEYVAAVHEEVTEVFEMMCGQDTYIEVVQGEEKIVGIVYDLVRGEIYQRTPDGPLQIPAGAVVVPGARAVNNERGRAWGLSLYAAIIVKYRDETTETSVQLEDYLR